MSEKYVLGIDTSNYKTSLAVVEDGRTVVDLRRFLKVKEGQRGLRQSEALFQHVQNLPELFSKARDAFDGEISAVAYSTRPRAVAGSYMPCFTAGAGQAISVAAALDVPAVGFSHQEGHIEAAVRSCGHDPDDACIVCHFSGGTCEVLKVTARNHSYSGGPGFGSYNGEGAFFEVEIIGGTKDISYGQVLDRAGVAMGLEFPCGEALDDIALSAGESTKLLTPIRVSDGQVNLSGFDTQLRNTLTRTLTADGSDEQAGCLIREAFARISDSITEMLLQSSKSAGISSIYMAGGVSSSRFIRENITERLQARGIDIYFAGPEMSSDNAVGTAMLGSRYLWD